MLIKEKIPLSSYSTIEIGGPATFLIEASTKEELISAYLWGLRKELPIFVVGRGSNTLFSDLGFSGLVIVNRYTQIEETSPGIFNAGSGTPLPLLSMKTASHGWSGLEWGLGIPGSIGGAIVMNAGASQSDISVPLKAVLFLHPDGTEEWIEKDNIHFSYRKSPFQEKKGVILEATFALTLDREARGRQLAQFNHRRKTQPYHEPSLGCVFKNPEGNSCGRLIDELGLKGFKSGGAHISPLHGNFITNPGGGKAEDVLKLIDLVEKKVKEEKNLDLEKEIRIVGY